MFHRRRPRRELDPRFPIHGFKILGPAKPLSDYEVITSVTKPRATSHTVTIIDRGDYVGEIEKLRVFWEGPHVFPPSFLDHPGRPV